MKFITYWTPILALAFMGGCADSGSSKTDGSTNKDGGVTDTDASQQQGDASQQGDAAQPQGDAAISTITPIQLDDTTSWVAGFTSDNKILYQADSEAHAGAQTFWLLPTTPGPTKVLVGPDPLPDPSNDMAYILNDVIVSWTNEDATSGLAELSIWKNGVALTSAPIPNAIKAFGAKSDGSKIMFTLDEGAHDGRQGTVRLCDTTGGAGSITASCGHAVKNSAIYFPAEDDDATCAPTVVYAQSRILIHSCAQNSLTGALLTFADNAGAPGAGTQVGTDAAVAVIAGLSPKSTKVMFANGDSSHVYIAKVDGTQFYDLGSYADLGGQNGGLNLTEDASNNVFAVFTKDGALKKKPTDSNNPATALVSTGASAVLGASSDTQYFLYTSATSAPYPMSYATLSDSGTGHEILAGATGGKMVWASFTANSAFALFADNYDPDAFTGTFKSYAIAGGAIIDLGTNPYEFVDTTDTHGVYVDNYNIDAYTADLYSLDAATGARALIKTGIDTYLFDLALSQGVYNPEYLIALSPDKTAGWFSTYDEATQASGYWYTQTQ